SGGSEDLFAAAGAGAQRRLGLRRRDVAARRLRRGAPSEGAPCRLETASRLGQPSMADSPPQAIHGLLSAIPNRQGAAISVDLALNRRAPPASLPPGLGCFPGLDDCHLFRGLQNCLGGDEVGCALGATS